MKTIPEQSAQTITDEIFGLYEKYGHEEYGESVTQLAHMVQNAQLAEEEGYDEEVILAAFFHDIGHLSIMMKIRQKAWVHTALCIMKS